MLLSFNVSTSGGATVASYCVVIWIYLMLKMVKQVFMLIYNLFISSHEVHVKFSAIYLLVFLLFTSSKLSFICGVFVKFMHFFSPKGDLLASSLDGIFGGTRVLHFNKVQLVFFSLKKAF